MSHTIVEHKDNFGNNKQQHGRQIKLQQIYNLLLQLSIINYQFFTGSAYRLTSYSSHQY